MRENERGRGRGGDERAKREGGRRESEVVKEQRASKESEIISCEHTCESDRLALHDLVRAGVLGGRSIEGKQEPRGCPSRAATSCSGAALSHHATPLKIDRAVLSLHIQKDLPLAPRPADTAGPPEGTLYHLPAQRNRLRWWREARDAHDATRPGCTHRSSLYTNGAHILEHAMPRNLPSASTKTLTNSRSKRTHP